jgi:hypothetical protein
MLLLKNINPKATTRWIALSLHSQMRLQHTHKHTAYQIEYLHGTKMLISENLSMQLVLLLKLKKVSP